jgi:hypothetical protein
MIKYRVTTKKGYTEFAEKSDECIAFHSENGIGEIEELPIEQPQWNLEFITPQLSAAFDIKFETYWKAKGYTDTTDLLSHAANPDSVYHSEALSLIQWSHNEWEAAIADIDENSNIEEIINSLEPYA